MAKSTSCLRKNRSEQAKAHQNIRTFVQENEKKSGNDDVPDHFKGQSPRTADKIFLAHILLQKQGVREAVDHPTPDRMNIAACCYCNGYDKSRCIERINAKHSVNREQAQVACSFKALRNYKTRNQKESDHSRLTQFEPGRNEGGFSTSFTEKSALIQRMLQ